MATNAITGPARTYGMALAASAAAFTLSLLLSEPARSYTVPELFLAAVAVSAWYGGLAGGLFATAVSTLVSLYFFVPPFQSFVIGSPGAAAQLGVFLLTALIISALRGRVRAAGARASASARAAERQQRRGEFLAEASRTLASSLDYESTLASVARLAVPYLGDLCIVDVLEEDGSIRRLAIEHTDAEMARFARELNDRYPVDPARPHPVLGLLRSGRPAILPEVTDELLVRISRDADQLAGYRRLGVVSAMGAPLIARGRTLGAISFITSTLGRRYGAEDLRVAEDLGGRCAVAIDNARLFRAAEAKIAERNQAEQRLRESEEHLKLAFDAAHMGTWDWDLRTGEVHVDWGGRVEVSGGGEPTFAGSIAEFVERIHPDDRGKITEAIERATSERADFEVEVRAFWPGGIERWVASRGKVVCDDDGNPVRLIGVPMDVTERKRTEQRLAVQYETTRILSECATLEEATPHILRAVCECLGWVYGGLWRVDHARGVLRCVETWKLSTVSLPEFEAASREAAFTPGVGLPGRVWASGESVWIADVVHDANFPRAPVAAKEGLHGAFGFPVRVGGDVLGVLEFFSPTIVPPDQELLVMMGTIGTQIGQFIQRRRGEEERVRLLERVQAAHAEARAAERRSAFLAEASRVLSTSLEDPGTLDALAQLAVPQLADWCAVDILDDEGLIRRVGAAHVDSAKVDLVRTFLDRYTPSADDPLRGAIAQGRSVLLSAVPEEGFVTGRRDAEQRARELAIRSFMLVPLVARGRSLGSVGFSSATPGRYGPADVALAEDLAHRAALAIDNARLYREAQEAARRKDEFLAMLGHELRNPLAAIQSSVEVLDRISSQAEPAVRQRAIIDRQSRNLGRLVDDLLDVSRVVSGKISLRRGPVDVNRLAARCLESLRRRIDERQQQATFTPAEEPVIVRGDAVRLEQVVLNLLDNAIKYTPPAGQIALSVERLGPEMVLRVRDSGMGISPELLPRVFDLFAQAERSLDRAQGGLGLGLTLVRRLIEQHGGSVAASSAGPDRGSEFLVSLPVLDGVTAPEPVPERPAETEPTRGRHILLIEDNVDGREALRVLLELWGHRVDVAGDGPAGIELARQSPPELALVDIGLPGVDGYQVAAALRAADGPRIRLIALTGYGQAEDRRRALEAGFDAHLVKPVEPDELMRALAASGAADAA